MDKRQKEIIIGQAYNLAAAETKNIKDIIKKAELRLYFTKVFTLELAALQSASIDNICAACDDLASTYTEEE